MPAAAHGDGDARLPCELHRVNDVGDACTLRDQRRVPIDRAVPQPSGGVVIAVPGAHEAYAERALKIRDILVVELGAFRQSAHNGPPENGLPGQVTHRSPRCARLSQRPTPATRWARQFPRTAHLDNTGGEL